MKTATTYVVSVTDNRHVHEKRLRQAREQGITGLIERLPGDPNSNNDYRIVSSNPDVLRDAGITTY